jgi:hypothetical protein
MRKSAQQANDVRSWHEDKAVQDNIVESWLCVDCGVNTAPGCPDGPQTRIDMAITGESKCEFDSNTEVYDVQSAIWKKAGMRGWSGCLCIGCLESRLGRQLRPRDFTSHDRKTWAQFPCTERLLNRRGFATANVLTPDGPAQVICALEDASELDGTFLELAAEPA